MISRTKLVLALRGRLVSVRVVLEMSSRSPYIGVCCTEARTLVVTKSAKGVFKKTVDARVLHRYFIDTDTLYTVTQSLCRYREPSEVEAQPRRLLIHGPGTIRKPHRADEVWSPARLRLTYARCQIERLRESIIPTVRAVRIIGNRPDGATALLAASCKRGRFHPTTNHGRSFPLTEPCWHKRPYRNR